ncbi:MAG TPA: DmsC/YnfH family molybdoenzyme membrane anchor subunit [Candidatus Binatia bacterium]|nr:DmsC/YnfH family molybdoenzyme membrane anchor subunit [Candidatus Binatia bacterium]
MHFELDKPDLIENVLAEQGRMTPVVRFSRAHEQHELAPGSRYRDLIPLSLPQTGQQFAFEVNLDKCSGCKACVTACHALNGLDEGEAWRETGLLVSDDWRNPFQQVVTSACHHCLDPGCLNGCPVLAYEKDPITGIVRHLDDQCIGCQYCILTCPYEVPKYSTWRGIVRKCDMCSDRLLAGEAPACVQACPNESIRITRVANDAIASYFLPGTPDPSITRPTTHYISARPLPASLKASDRETVRPQPAHWPLVFMLVLTQMSAGLYLFAFAFQAVLAASLLHFELHTALLCLCAGLSASVLHLGRPRGAWRAFLGLRRSWLSREILAFGLCLPFAIAYTFTTDALFGFAAVITALAGVFCSAMIYDHTHREFWTLAMTGPKFFGATFLFGSVAQIAGLACLGAAGDAPRFLFLLCAALAACAFLLKLAAEERVMRALARDDFSQLHKTALLLSGRFGLWRRIRVACGIAGGVCFPALLALHGLPAGPGPDSSSRLGLVAAGIAFCFAGELIERWLFFAAVQPIKMPG